MEGSCYSSCDAACRERGFPRPDPGTLQVAVPCASTAPTCWARVQETSLGTAGPIYVLNRVTS